MPVSLPSLAGGSFGGAVLLALAARLAPADDVAARIKAKEPEDRVAAVEQVRRDGHKDAEKLLLDALDDRDWEVMERAALALGERGSVAGSGAALSKLAIGGPIRRVRLAAAQALARLDPAGTAELLTKSVRSAPLEAVCEGLAAVAATVGEPVRPGLETGLLSKEGRTRAVAASGLHAFGAAERASHLDTCLGDSELTVGAAALDSATRHPDPGLLPALLAILARKELHEVFERRAINAIEATLAAAAGAEREGLAAKVFEAAQQATADPALTRFARLIGRLGTKRERTAGGAGGAAAAASAAGDAAKAAALIDAGTALAWLEPVVSRGGERAGAAATKALALLATENSLDKLGFIATGNGAPRVRSIALRGLVDAAGADSERWRTTALKLLNDADADVREDAAVALGRPRVSGAVAALRPLLKDKEWPVAVAAAVSLGKTQEADALAPLVELAKHKEWKLAGAALVGLGHLKKKEAVPALIAGLGERSPTLKLTAFESLRRMTRDKVPARESSWKSWWGKSEASYAFPDPDEAARQQQKYGYSPSAYGVYEDLDVLVFQSRGDHIEKLLDSLKIAHRKTRGNEVAESGVSPLGIYVANCTGECSTEDLEQVQWAVHAGGYLFASCWALTHHAARVRPAFVRGIDESRITDLVTAEPCLASPYLAGAFDGSARPKYALDGPHLIDVVDPERVEVLIDSPECATRHRNGNMAAWWTVGHGLILDSVNHFDLQGFGRAPPMKEATERMAYAVDVLGLTYADLREIPRGAWQSQEKAKEEVRDLSAFRFITNFVRQRRKSGV
jgi:HEAT repeat protein